MAKEFKISTLRLKELEQELHYLKTTREKEVAEQIKEARSFGDLSENSEYDEAKNEQAKLYGRIAEVENILAHAVIIDENEDAEGKIGLGCTIKVLDMETEEEEIYAIVGSQTYGKGNFQTAFYLSEGSMVNLSIGKYYTPGGKSLSETGVTPDVVVDLDDEQYALLYYNALERADDPQFQAAIDTLTQKIS